MGWFLRLSCLVIVLFGLYVIWQFVQFHDLRPFPPHAPPHHGAESVPAAYRSSVPALPVDHVLQRHAI